MYLRNEIIDDALSAGLVREKTASLANCMLNFEKNTVTLCLRIESEDL